jgi:NADP-dependent 3-hydroxy acid dehydrogenase YdfG
MAKAEVRPVSGRVVAITGAARGIGKATAQALVRRGAKVAIGDLDVPLAEQTAAEIGGETVAFELDVTSRQSFERFIAQVEERLGPLDVLVNNAGIMPVGLILEEDDAAARRIIDIDVHGVILGTKLALERMVPRGDGHIVNIASQAGKAGIPGLATYCAAKHAVVGFSEAVRGEHIETGIEISCVMPAVVNTELTSGVKDTRGVKRVEPEDVAEAIVAALERPRFDVHVPRSAGVIGQMISPLPRRAREAIGRGLGMDTLMIDVDTKARAAYEARAAASAPTSEHSAPAADEGSEEKETAASG